MAWPDRSGGGATSAGTGLQAGDGSGGLVAASAATIGAPVTVVTTQTVAPASATPSPSGLSVTVTAGATYSFEIFYYSTSSATANTTINLNSGTATMTSIVGMMSGVQAGGPQTGAAITGYTSTFNDTIVTGASFEIYATGTFVVNAGGTFAPGYATAPASTNTLLAGSWMRLTRIT